MEIFNKIEELDGFFNKHSNNGDSAFIMCSNENDECVAKFIISEEKGMTPFEQMFVAIFSSRPIYMICCLEAMSKVLQQRIMSSLQETNGAESCLYS